MKKLVLTGLLAACAAVSTRASIICLAPTSTTAGSIQITDPITFNVTAQGNVKGFVLSGWVTDDGTQTGTSLAPNLQFSLNGTAIPDAATALYDNLDGKANAVGPNDGLFYYNSSFFAYPGDTVTLSAGTYSLGAVSGFNPQATQTFNGNMFLINDDLGALSGSTPAGTVPEPSTWALLGVGTALLGLALRRRAARV